MRQASLSALLSEGPAVVAASVGITYETKQSETTQDIIHKGPVCRQQAELGHTSSWWQRPEKRYDGIQNFGVFFQRL